MKILRKLRVLPFDYTSASLQGDLLHVLCFLCTKLNAFQCIKRLKLGKCIPMHQAPEVG